MKKEEIEKLDLDKQKELCEVLRQENEKLQKAIDIEKLERQAVEKSFFKPIL